MDFYRNVVMLCCMLFFLQVFGVLNASESLQGIPDDQQMAYQMLNLKADASDDDIIKKLDDPYGPMAMNLIMRKNIVSAVPRLLAMVRDEKAQVLYRCVAAETLSYFGHNEWMPVLKNLAAVYIPQDGGDLNSKIKLAGTLAKIDNSYLPFVLENTNNKQEIIRVVAVRALSGYDDPNSISDIASDAILTCAQNDPNSSVRFEAILSMEHMCSKKPRYEDKFLKALNANIDSKHENVRRLSNEKLGEYKRKKALK